MKLLEAVVTNPLEARFDNSLRAFSSNPQALSGRPLEALPFNPPEAL